jgi:hypothetical protein
MMDDGEDEDDADEDMFGGDDDDKKFSAKASTSGGDSEDPVALVFPTTDREEEAAEDNWPWSVCGGLIGGAMGANRFCIKPLEDGGLRHFGLGSHAQKKAALVEGFGYIPNNGDRLNTRSAFLNPTVDARSLPEAYLESLQSILPLTPGLFLKLISSPCRLYSLLRSGYLSSLFFLRSRRWRT